MKTWPFEHILPEKLFRTKFKSDVGILTSFIRSWQALRDYGTKTEASIKAIQKRHLKLGRKAQDALKVTEYVELISKGCYYCETDLKQRSGIRLDRIDNSKGYEQYNVVPCCHSCNMLRGDRLTVEETQAVVALLKSMRVKST